MDCSTPLCAPDGPSTPFGDPMLAVIDTSRVITITLGLLIVILSFLASWRLDGRHASRFLALSVFSLAAALTEVDHFGDYASYRTLLNIAACALGTYGTWCYLYDLDGQVDG